MPFLFFRVCYGDEWTVHLGSLREATHPRLAGQVRGSSVLTLRGSRWTLVSSPRQSLTVASPDYPGDKGRSFNLADLETTSSVEAGAVVIEAVPHPLPELGGFGLTLLFSDHCRLIVRPHAEPETPQDAGLPVIADWELFTPYGCYLRVGPGMQ